MRVCVISNINASTLFQRQKIQHGETALVLEEDSFLDATSAERMLQLARDLVDIDWSLLMLESGHITTSGPWREVGVLAATCASPSPLSLHSDNMVGLPKDIDKKTAAGNQTCIWMGSRGYLIQYEGAQKLLQYARPFIVQVDALMGLVAAYHPDFAMFW